MTRSLLLRSAFLLGSLFLTLALVSAEAGSAIWNLNPSSGSWDTATNWTPATVPNGPSDIATFGVFNQTDLSLPLQHSGE